MQKTKINADKLQFFSASVEKMETEIDRIFYLYREKRIAQARAAEQFQTARDDMQEVYFRIQRKIDSVEQALRDYKRMAGYPQSRAGQTLTQATVKAIESLFHATRHRVEGTISKKELRRQAREVKRFMRSDVKALRKDVKTAVNYAEKQRYDAEHPERLDDWRVQAEDMMIKKVRS